MERAIEAIGWAGEECLGKQKLELAYLLFSLLRCQDKYRPWTSDVHNICTTQTTYTTGLGLDRISNMDITKALGPVVRFAQTLVRIDSLLLTRVMREFRRRT